MYQLVQFTRLKKKPKSQKKKQLEKLFKADIDIHLHATTK